jgi:microcystin-dependent protein
MKNLISVFSIATAMTSMLGAISCVAPTDTNTTTQTPEATAPLVTSMTWGGTSNGQVQALGLNYYIANYGVFPQANAAPSAAGTPYLGEIMLFAGDTAPRGWLPCDGALLNISQNQALFFLLSTTYGGDGTSSFALPDLRGRVAMGVGTLAGSSGTPTPTSPGTASAPVISAITRGGSSQGQAPALGINYYIAKADTYPLSGSTNTSTGSYTGQIKIFAGDVTPGGWALCDGSLLDISANNTLFNLIGTTYGGNGTLTFALPDLRARAPMGAGVLAHPVAIPSVSASAPSVPLISSLIRGETSQGQIETLGLNYYIADFGADPTAGSPNTSGFFRGQVMLFAGNFAPGGWSACDGSTQKISDNPALFNTIAATYGGNGTSNFAVPDLRSRVVLGARP